jgi:hypothetical protein
MFKSKHSGWTWDLKRTPFGGGGGFFGGIGDALASVDPGPAIGEGLASADKFMTNLTPYGWALPAALVAAYFTGGGSLAAEGAAEAGAAAAGEAAATEAATAAGQTAFSEAVAAGASEEAATAAANAAAESSLASSTGAAAETGYGGASSVGNLNSAVSGEIGANTGAGTFGSLNPALPSAGAPTGTSIGMSGALSPGTVLGTGLEGGGSIGSSYAVGPNGLPATDFFGRPIPASSVNFGGVPNTIAGTTATTTNTDLAKLLKQGAGSGLSKSLGQLAQGANLQGQALSPWVHGNQNPFTQTAQQPIQNAPKLDLASLASLLKQG